MSNYLTSIKGTDIFDVRSVINNSPKNAIVNLKKGSCTTRIPGNSTDFVLPENVSMSRLGAETVVKELMTESGSSMADKLQANASARAMQKSLRRSTQCTTTRVLWT